MYMKIWFKKSTETKYIEKYLTPSIFAINM